MNIGFFDSGIGGLSVLREAVAMLPNESFIYYGDTKNAPYGVKSTEEVKRLTFNAVMFMAERNLKALVVACNTATSAAVRDLRKEYGFPVIGMEPAVKPAVQKSLSGGKRVLVLATALTLKEEKFHNLVSRLDADHIVDMLPAPGLVEFAEKFIFRGPEVDGYLKEILPWNEIHNYSTLVLGCTHFPFFRQALSNVLPSHIDIIDGNAGTVRHLIEVLKSLNLLNQSSADGHVAFFKSGDQVKDPETLAMFRKLVYS